MPRPPADFQPDAPNDTVPVAVVAPPAGAPALPPNPPTPNPLLRSTLAPSQQLQPDAIRQFYSKGVPQIRISPLPVQASAATGATAASQSKAQSGAIAQQAAEAQIAAQSANSGVTAIQTPPANVTGLSVSEAVIKDATGVLEQYLFVTFVPPAANYYAVDIFAVGYQGSTQPVLVGSSQVSPANFSLHITGETITLYVVAYSKFGVYSVANITSAPSITAILNGVTTAPPAPTIASSLAPTTSGVTFAWNIENDPTHDVIAGYRVYKNTVNNSTTATAIANVLQPSITTGTHVFNDVLGAGHVAYYWVSCFNSSSLESTLTPAQSSAVQSGTIAYRGAYDGSTTYNPGDDVTYSGQFYTCILQSTGNLPTNVTFWQPTGATSGDVFLGAWSNVTAYVPGNQVTYSGGYYICIASSTGNIPASSPAFWQIVGSVNTYIFLGAYNSGTAYVVGNQVTLNGAYWICISGTTGNAPSTTSSFWTLVGTSALFLGAYSGAVQYVPGNEVTLNGNVYQCILATVGNTPPNPTYWQLMGTSSQFLGAYNNATAYVAGNQVIYNGNYYICIAATTGNLPTNATFWQQISLNSSEFLGAYNNSFAYVPGNQVTYLGGYYVCVVATTGNLPTNPVFWQAVSTANTYVYTGVYNNATAYVPGNEVTYQGSFWICISATTGNVPVINSGFWTLVGTSALFLGAWFSGTTYPQGAQVAFLNNVFTALQTNTGNQPPTPPTTSSFWQLIGPASLDDLANGIIYIKGVQYDAVTIAVPNANFEASASLPVPGWFGSGATLSYDTATPQSGNQSLKVTGISQFGGALSVQKWAVTPGDTYLVSGYVKSDGVGIPVIQLQFSDKNGASTGGVQVGGTTATSWALISASGTVPVGTVTAVLGLQNNAATQPSVVEFDNIYAFRALTLASEVGDGPTRFAATASSLTYRPLSNPLTGHDAGSTATVNIAAFTMRTSNKGDFNYNSGSIPALSHGTLYYIFYDDGGLAGGTPPGGYQATTTKTTAINGAGRFFLGSIITPTAGAPDTVGNNDGGVGAQYGSTALFLFGATAITSTSAFVGGVNTVIAGTVNTGNAIDGDLTTFAEMFVNGASAVAAASIFTITGASPTSAPWTSLTLYVLSAVPLNTVNPGTTPAAINYSVLASGGASGTIMSVGPATTRALTLDSVPLPINTNLAQLQVQASVFRNNGTGQQVKLDIYGVWVVGLQ